MAFTSIFDKIPLEKQNEIIAYAKENGVKAAAQKYLSESPYKDISSFYQGILYRVNSEKKEAERQKSENGLTKEEEQLLLDFQEGKVGYDRIQKELATRVFKKILMNPDAVNVRDWLQSELVKLKQDETTKQKDALEKFINSLFGGFLPSTVCPHCHKSTIIKTEELGEIIDAAELPTN